jgi:hypothetical protein
VCVVIRGGVVDQVVSIGYCRVGEIRSGIFTAAPATFTSYNVKKSLRSNFQKKKQQQQKTLLSVDPCVYIFLIKKKIEIKCKSLSDQLSKNKTLLSVDSSVYILNREIKI